MGLRDKPISNESYSSFAAVEKLLQQIVERLMKNERLQKLLFYSDKHCLDLPSLNQNQVYSLLNNQIKTVPKLKVDDEVMAYVIISFDHFEPDDSNPANFRKIILSIDIFCHYDYWALDDFRLRPYSIAGAIDGVLNKSSFNALGGIANFISADQLVLNEYLGGVTLTYSVDTLGEDYDRTAIL